MARNKIRRITTLSLLIMFVGCLVMPANPMFWLGSPAIGYCLLRLVLISLLSVFNYLGVPSNQYFRFVLGVSSALLAAWATVNTYKSTMSLLDGLSLIAAGSVLCADALDSDAAARERLNWQGVSKLFAPLNSLLIRKLATGLAIIIMVGAIEGPSSLHKHLSYIY